MAPVSWNWSSHYHQPHSFRGPVVTGLLSQDGPLGDLQSLAGHANPRTTKRL